MRTILSHAMTVILALAGCPALADSVPNGFPRSAPPPLSRVDVVGIRIGMTFEQAAEAVRSYDSRLQLTAHEPQGPNIYAPAVLRPDWSAHRPAMGRQSSAESITLRAEPGPLPAVVTQVRRKIVFAPAERPSSRSVAAALRTKYGPPHVTDSHGMLMRWHFAADGGAFDARACPLPVSSAPPLLISEWRAAGAIARNCGLVVWARLVEVGPSEPGMAWWLEVVMADLPLTEERARAMASWLANRTADEATAAREAAGRPAPRF